MQSQVQASVLSTWVAIVIGGPTDSCLVAEGETLSCLFAIWPIYFHNCMCVFPSESQFTRWVYVQYSEMFTGVIWLWLCVISRHDTMVKKEMKTQQQPFPAQEHRTAPLFTVQWVVGYSATLIHGITTSITTPSTLYIYLGIHSFNDSYSSCHCIIIKYYFARYSNNFLTTMYK